MAIAHVARAKVITSVWLYTAGINIIFLHTTLSSNPAIFKTQHYSSTTLKPPRVSEKQDRWMARDDAGEKVGVRQPGKWKKTPAEEKLDRKTSLGLIIVRENQVQAAQRPPAPRLHSLRARRKKNWPRSTMIKM